MTKPLGDFLLTKLIGRFAVKARVVAVVLSTVRTATLKKQMGE